MNNYYHNICIRVSNYNTSELSKNLSLYGKYGYELKSTLIAPNQYGVNAMFLFFSKPINTPEDGDVDD